jgi:hypothetical protein
LQRASAPFLPWEAQIQYTSSCFIFENGGNWVTKSLRSPQLLSFLTCCETQRFVSMTTRACHWSLSLLRRIQSTFPVWSLLRPIYCYM